MPYEYNSPNALVAIVVPIWKPTLTASEHMNVEVTFRSNPGVQRYFMAPIGMDLSYYRESFSGTGFYEIPDNHLQTVESYSAFMLTPGLYEHFSFVDFVAICQTDAFLVQDISSPLSAVDWDYVGAPWTTPMKLNRWSVTVPTALTPLLRKAPFKAQLHVGNGGLSIRRTSTFARALADLGWPGFGEEINEDVAISYLGHRKVITVATRDEAQSWFFERGPAVPPTTDVRGYHALEKYYPSEYGALIQLLRSKHFNA